MRCSWKVDLLLAASILASLPFGVRAEDAPGATPPLGTLEDVFAAFVPGEPWPQGKTPLHQFLEDGPRSNRPNGATQLRGIMDGYDVGVTSNADDGTVKGVYASMELAAGDAAAGAKQFERMRALFGAVAGKRACKVSKVVKPARTFRQAGLHRAYEVRKMLCDDGKVEIEAFLDLGERVEVKKGAAPGTPGHVGLTARLKDR